MTFRRSNQEEVGSSRWRTKNKYLLVRWLPQSVVDSDRSLTYVLLHGDDELETGLNPDWLSQDAAREFLEFLEGELPNPSGYQILMALQKRVADEFA